MKLNPDGSIEGTPEECARYKQIQFDLSHSKPFKVVPRITSDELKKIEEHNAYELSRRM